MKSGTAEAAWFSVCRHAPTEAPCCAWRASSVMRAGEPRRWLHYHTPVHPSRPLHKYRTYLIILSIFHLNPSLKGKPLSMYPLYTSLSKMVAQVFCQIKRQTKQPSLRSSFEGRHCCCTYYTGTSLSTMVAAQVFCHQLKTGTLTAAVYPATLPHSPHLPRSFSLHPHSYPHPTISALIYKSNPKTSRERTRGFRPVATINCMLFVSSFLINSRHCSTRRFQFVMNDKTHVVS